MNADILIGAAEWVWRTSLGAACLFLVIAVLQGLLQKWLPIRLRLALWWLVAIRLLLPVAPPSPFSIWNLWPALQSSRTVSESVAATDQMSIATSTPPALPKQSAGRPSDWRTIASCVWLAGALVLLSIIFWQQLRFARWVRRQPSLEAWQDTLREATLQMGIRRSVRVIETTVLTTPAVFGIRNPHIIVPRNLLQALNREQLLLVLFHELAHLKRHDVLQNWLLIVLQSVHWFNPAIWLAFYRLRAERELVCDSDVLAPLSRERRALYGTTLIQIASSAGPSRIAPVLVPILSRIKHIEKRVHMIAKFKPASRLAMAASGVALGLMAWVTLTGATDRPVPAKVTGQPSLPQSAESAEDKTRLLDRMQQELASLNAQIEQAQDRVDQLRKHLGITAVDEAGDKTDPEPLRKMESLWIEQAAEHQKLSSLYAGLTKMSRPELLRAVVTALPDQLLTALLDQQATAEQRLTEAEDSFGSDHPSVKAGRRVLKQIQLQIDQRIEGILEGLKIRARSVQETADQLEREISRTKETQVDRAIKIRPYFRARREIENLESVYDDFHKRLMQARIDAALARPALGR